MVHLTRILIFLLAIGTSQCSLRDWGIVSDNSQEKRNEAILAILGLYTLNLADARVSGIAIYFEDPNNRAQTAKRAHRVQFRKGKLLGAGESPNSIPGDSEEPAFSIQSKRTVSLQSLTSDRGEFEVFLKYASYVGMVYDGQNQLRGEFGFDLVKINQQPRIRNRDIPENLFIRISATSIGPAGSTDATGGVGETDEDSDTEPIPEIFN